MNIQLHHYVNKLIKEEEIEVSSIWLAMGVRLATESNPSVKGGGHKGPGPPLGNLCEWWVIASTRRGTYISYF